jgi:hypothetical protein
MPRRLRLVPAVVALAALAALATAPTASARVDGPCTAGIAGQDISERDAGPLSNPIEVDDDAPVSVTMSSAEPISRLKVEIEFAGVGWTVNERDSTGTSWASEVPVHDYAVYGVGLYKVVGRSYGRGFTCTASAIIDVQSEEPLDPLVTVAGLGGLTAGLIGLFGVLAVTLRAGRTGAVSVLGSAFFGLVMGAGMAALFQQFSVLYPTLGVTGALVAGGAALGLTFSLFGLPARSDAR